MENQNNFVKCEDCSLLMTCSINILEKEFFINVYHFCNKYKNKNNKNVRKI